MPDNELSDKYGGPWGEYPNYPVTDWVYEVNNGDTRLGYWEWVDTMLERKEIA